MVNGNLYNTTSNRNNDKPENHFRYRDFSSNSNSKRFLKRGTTIENNFVDSNSNNINNPYNIRTGSSNQMRKLSEKVTSENDINNAEKRISSVSRNYKKPWLVNTSSQKEIQNQDSKNTHGHRNYYLYGNTTNDPETGASKETSLRSMRNTGTDFHTFKKTMKDPYDSNLDM